MQSSTKTRCRDALAEQKSQELCGYSLNTSLLRDLVSSPNSTVTVSRETQDKIHRSHALLESMVAENRIIYGVNTSMGGFVHWLVPTSKAQEMQENLISAVATNVGICLRDEIVRAGMLSRLNSLARGTSGISFDNFSKLLDMYNRGIIPCIPMKGSLGASGDLGPLACIALVGSGKWKAKYKGQVMPGKVALKKANIQPMALGYKEGLSLINGTSVMSGYAAILIEQAKSLLDTYAVISALTFQALKARKEPFNPIVHSQKPHLGQLYVAKSIWTLVTDSKMVCSEHEIDKILKEHISGAEKSMDIAIEDSYSVRCTPQIMGPIWDSFASIKNTVENELNSSNDNPLIIPEVNDVFHNGHFHGQYMAMAMDHCSIGLTTLSNLSDRRIDRLLDANHSNGLPPFLCKENPGLRLGLMGSQFMATSLTAENRSLCHPVSTQTLTSTGDFQDIVSMGLIAARRADEIYENTCQIVACEALLAAQAIDIRGSHLISNKTKATYELIRDCVPYLDEDVPLTEHLEKIKILLQSHDWLQIVARACS